MEELGQHAAVTVVIAHLPERVAMLERAVRSVQGQTHQPLLLLVGQADPGEDAATVRNNLLTQVTTEWVAFLDDDDELLPDHVALCLAMGEAATADLVYPWMYVIGAPEPFAVTYRGELRHPMGVPFGPEQARHLRERGNYIPVTHLVRTRALRAVGGFPPPAPGIPEDYGLLLRLVDAGALIVHVPARTWVYHFHDGNTGGVR
jgi:GT2 family glycosyltransferase